MLQKILILPLTILIISTVSRAGFPGPVVEYLRVVKSYAARVGMTNKL